MEDGRESRVRPRHRSDKKPSRSKNEFLVRKDHKKGVATTRGSRAVPRWLGAESDATSGDESASVSASPASASPVDVCVGWELLEPAAPDLRPYGTRGPARWEWGGWTGASLRRLVPWCRA